jgi:AraC-like DNA-binding protein
VPLRAHQLEAPDEGFDRLHADLLRYFPDLVADLGGDADALLRQTGVPRTALEPGSASLGTRDWVQLLHGAAQALGCVDFGLRLAARQGDGSVFGSMAAVMTNSKTFGDGLRYVAEHTHAHSLAARIRLTWDPGTRTLFSAHDLLVDRLPNRAQAVEQLLLLGHLNAAASTGGRARVREVRMRHQPLSPLKTYRRYFGCEVLFDQQDDGVVYAERDLLAPILDADARAYERATADIEAKFPHASPPMHAQVRGVVLELLGAEDCSNEAVAAKLNLHSRTLHRRLRAEGAGFQEIKDEVRRDLASYYLEQTDFDLAYVAQKLGYAEHSVFTRSCVRWFDAAPSLIRSRRRG